MTQKHTPWEVGSCQWPEQIGCCPLVGRPYSIHGTDNRNVAAAVSEDIARLISAAPDMLALVKLVHESFGGGAVVTFSESDIAEFAAVYAKATGDAQ